MKRKKFTILIMIVLLFNIFSYSYAAAPFSTIEIDDEEYEQRHIEWHKEQDLFMKKRTYLASTFFILIVIMILFFSILSKYKNIEFIYTIFFVILSIAWLIIGGFLIGFNTIVDLIFHADSLAYESIIGLSILLELILLAINKFITHKNRNIILSTVLITFIGYQILKIINGYEDSGKFINILLFINLAMLPIYLSNRRKLKESK